MMLEYLPHQIKMSDRVLDKVRRYGFAILAAEERTGKTGAFIRAVELSSAYTCLIVTKKAAISGIQDQIASFSAIKKYTVTNYQSLHKLTNIDFDVIILDEFHQGVCSYPKPSETFKALKPICTGKPIIFVSATPFSETYSQAYHALALSDYSPFLEHKNFYSFHRALGVECSVYFNGRSVQQYHLTKDLKPMLSPFMISMTRAQIGFEHEPTDRLHTVALDSKTKARISELKKDKVIEHLKVEALSIMGEMVSVHMLAGGGILKDDEYIELSSEKIDYIHEYFNPKTTAIMAHYKAEQERLGRIFPNVFSSTAQAEGVDLSHFDNLVIYSQNFSTSKFTQRRARQARIDRATPIVVHFLLADYGLDAKLYDAVAKKKSNFTARVYGDLFA